MKSTRFAAMRNVLPSRSNIVTSLISQSERAILSSGMSMAVTTSGPFPKHSSKQRSPSTLQIGGCLRSCSYADHPWRTANGGWMKSSNERPNKVSRSLSASTRRSKRPWPSTALTQSTHWTPSSTKTCQNMPIFVSCAIPITTFLRMQVCTDLPIQTCVRSRMFRMVFFAPRHPFLLHLFQSGTRSSR